MIELKCPVCNTVLDRAFLTDKVWGCPKCRNIGNVGLWELLTDTKKKLDTLQEFVTKLYLNGNITDEQLERYKKVLIRALEQKDVK